MPIAERTGGRTAMVVDDSSVTTRVMADTLAVLGYRCEVFTSAACAFEWLHTHTPDVALIDVLMPGIGGLDLLDAIKSDGHLFPVFLMTASPQRDTEQEARAMGAVAVLEKPVSINTLVEVSEFRGANPS